MNKLFIIIIALLIIILSILLCGCNNKATPYAEPPYNANYTAIIEMPNGEITEVDAYTYTTREYGRIIIIYTVDGNKIRVSNCKVAIIDK